MSVKKVNFNSLWRITIWTLAYGVEVRKEGEEGGGSTGTKAKYMLLIDGWMDDVGRG